MTIFSGTSYLGLDRHPLFLELVKEGLDLYGTHYGGSRLSPLTPEIYEEAEAALARWIGAPAVLLVGSGTTAGQLAARYFAANQQSLHLSPLAHPALSWPQGSQHTSWGSWLDAIQLPGSVAFTDGVDPLKVSLPPWEAIRAAAPTTLLVDDSHLIGAYGAGFAGSWPMLYKQFASGLLVTASLGKALALPAGLIIGSKETITQIRALPQFGGASPPAPAFLHAWLNGAEIIEQQRNQLHQHIKTIHELLAHEERVGLLANFPVISLRNHEWVAHLHKKNIEISSFRYPVARSPRYSRIVLRADHSRQEIDFLCECLSELMDA